MTDEIQQLEATLERVKALLPKWEEDVKNYPYSSEGTVAMVAVRLCHSELEAAVKGES